MFSCILLATINILPMLRSYITGRRWTGLFVGSFFCMCLNYLVNYIRLHMLCYKEAGKLFVMCHDMNEDASMSTRIFQNACFCVG